MRSSPFSVRRLMVPEARQAASVSDWAGIVDAVGPWVEYAVPLFSGVFITADDDKKDGEVIGQVKTVLLILKCFKSSTSVTTVEDGVTVTHAEQVFEDLK